MKKVIVLLPRGKLFDELFSEAIRPAAESEKTIVVRLETEFSAERQLGPICQEIESADLAIADLTGRNPHVMYQVGFAHGLGKRVLFLAQRLEDFPFDSAKHCVIGYAGDRAFLRKELESFFAGGPSSTSQPPTSSNDPRAKFLSIFGEILAAHNYQHRGKIELENSTTFVLLDQDMDLPLVQDLARRARELGLRLKLM